MTDLTIFRTYEPHELGKDGYPIAWHDITTAYREQFERGLIAYNPDAFYGRGIKHLVREQAGNRCIRCGHPYVVGESGAWEDTPGSHPAEAMAETLEGMDFGALDATVKNVKGTLWSRCDGLCTHRGPIRVNGGIFEDETPVIHVNAGHVVEAPWRILTVHHLNERKHDCRWHNLCSLCQRCHLYIQRKVEMNQVFPFEHSEWFKPYAAAFYAYSYLGEELTREETMERLDELLGLERIT